MWAAQPQPRTLRVYKKKLKPAWHHLKKLQHIVLSISTARDIAGTCERPTPPIQSAPPTRPAYQTLPVIMTSLAPLIQLATPTPPALPIAPALPTWTAPMDPSPELWARPNLKPRESYDEVYGSLGKKISKNLLIDWFILIAKYKFLIRFFCLVILINSKIFINGG